jgi:hypothetical protein
MSVTAFNRRRRELAAKEREQTEPVKTEAPGGSDGAAKPAKTKRKGGDKDAGD